MAKYEVGDSFVVTITEVDEAGMGIAYTLNDSAYISERDMDCFEKITPLSEDVKEEEKPQTPHTPEDLLSRIHMLSNLLTQTIEKYVDIKGCLEVGIDELDAQIERLRL